MMMSIEEVVIETLKDMPPDAKRRVLDFAESIRRENHLPVLPRKNPQGLWADLGVDITEEDIAEARREMWGNFPRDIEL
jgi:hypothetical protein